MKLNLLYIILIITLLGICNSRKSGLYPDQNDNDSDEEAQQQQEQNYNNEYNEYNEYNGYNNEYDSSVYENQQEDKKSALYSNSYAQYQDPNNGYDENYNQDNSNNQNNTENQETFRTRHEYKLSFKKPYYYYNDTNIIPNWEYQGDVIPAVDMVRLVPSVPNKYGGIWSFKTNQFDEWQIILAVRIVGRSIHGSQGMGIFYTERRLKPDSFYGGESTWNGLAIILDTLNLDENSNTPTINVLYNDGNTTVKSQKDYNDLRRSMCVADFRNSPLPVYLRITYHNKNLKVEVDLSHEGHEYYECTNDNIELPKDYLFGITAKTGSTYPDDHDILSFDFYEINPPYKENHIYRPMEEEILEREGEFQIDDETLEQIKQVEEQLAKERNKNDEKKDKFVDANTIHLTTYRTLEAVNRILSYLQNEKYSYGNNAQSTIIDDINDRTSQMMSDQNYLIESVNEVKQTEENISNSVERNSQKFEYKINSLESKVNQKISSEANKILMELNRLKEENKQLKEAIGFLARNAQSQPNVWIVVIVSFFINMLGIYVIVRVLPKSRYDDDLFKSHHY